MTPTDARLVTLTLYACAHREARSKRDAAILNALAAGLRQDDVATAAGLSAPAIRKIRDAARAAAPTEGADK